MNGNNLRSQDKKLYIIVPCFDEESVLPITSEFFLKELYALIEKYRLSDESYILFVDDGSRDATWEIIEMLSERDKHFIGMSLSRNTGHQNALLAGLMETKKEADITITIDCDGQDDISCMDKMIEEYNNGSEVVYGVRSDRQSDGAFKRVSAEFYYKFLKRLGGDVVYNHADYRLVSAKVTSVLSDFNEVNLFLRGIFPLIGFKNAKVYYERHERMGGKTKYSLKKMIALAFEGITSFSIKPIRFIMGMGIIIALISFLATIWSIIGAIRGDTVPGWASMTCIISFLGGVQLVCLGVLGEYIGKIYLETKRRPRYIVYERTWK